MPSDEIDAIYIHIPFCIKKCGYCDFLSFPISGYDRGKYVEYLKKEIRMYPSNIYDSVYIGGGTPSVLDADHIGSILKEINISPDAEVTIEVNPGTVDKGKLAAYKKFGINRISIGIQSFNDEYLRTLGRIHDSSTAIKTYYDAMDQGFDNVSLDLMFALPGEDIKGLNKDLDILFKLSPKHFSIYSLIWEKGTKFYDNLQKGIMHITDNDLEAQMYELIIEKARLEGYMHYEISNFARSGHISRHNIKYWQNKKYIGVGLGASGYVVNTRYRNIDEFTSYYASLDHNELPIGEKEIITEDIKNQYDAILGLRMLNSGFLPVTSEQKDTCALLEKRNLLEKKDDHYVLTSKGILIANDVMEEFL